MRAKVKSFLFFFVAFFFVFALAWLLETIFRAEAEIDRLYDTTVVSGTIRSEIPLEFAPAQMRFLGNTIAPQTVQRVKQLEFVRDLYVEAAHDWAIIIPANERGALPENWAEITGLDLSLETMMFTELADPLVAASDLTAFYRLNSIRYFEDIPGVVRRFSDGTFVQNFAFDFADEFCEVVLENFSHENNAPIPIILSESLAEIRGLSHGDVAYIGVTIGTTKIWEHFPAIVAGTHNRNITTNRARDSAILPLSALENLTHRFTGYTLLEFNICTTHNREINAAREEIEEILSHREASWGRIRLGVTLRDEELKIMVNTVDKTLGLLRLLYPAAVALSVAIAIFLSALLTLQNAKNAAIMRVLGATKIKTQITFCAEILILSFAGIFFGICVIFILNWNAEIIQNIFLSALYFAGTFAGAIVGAVFITYRPPLELLQVKE
jgi:hypothetical protein